jgi:AraC family transcriptional activator of tynA and feaB
MPVTSELRRWSTETLAPTQRLDYWVGAICEEFLEMTASSTSPDSFAGSLDSAACGPIAINRVRASAVDVWRTKVAISRSNEHNFYLISTRDVAWSVCQGGKSVHLRPSDVVLIDSEQRYHLSFPHACHTISIQVPPSWLASWLPDPQASVAHLIDGQVGWGKVLTTFMQQVTPEVAAQPQLPAPLLADQLGALLALASGVQRTDESKNAAAASLHTRILDSIDQRHTEAGLTAADIATSLGISERTLHRHLAQGNSTFLQAVMARRMTSALRLLMDKRFQTLTVAEIGRRCGFLDASHFSRLCRAHLGKPPLQLRKEL